MRHGMCAYFVSFIMQIGSHVGHWPRWWKALGCGMGTTTWGDNHCPWGLLSSLRSLMGLVSNKEQSHTKIGVEFAKSAIDSGKWVDGLRCVEYYLYSGLVPPSWTTVNAHSNTSTCTLKNVFSEAYLHKPFTATLSMHLFHTMLPIPYTPLWLLPRGRIYRSQRKPLTISTLLS